MSRRRTPRAAAKATLEAASPAELRALTSALLARADFAALAGKSFGGRRDIYTSLGYQDVLKPADYRGRYNRGGIAKSLVEAFPISTWRGGGELIENDDPETETPFEKAFHELNQRLGIWNVFLKTDILTGLGRFGVILLGAPSGAGGWAEPLERCRPEDLKYLWSYSERDVTIESYEQDTRNERFGQPLFYALKRISADGRSNMMAARVHYSRVIHVAEGVLDDPVFGTPRLQAVWNYLDDLDKIVGGGAEASWKRIDGGKQFKLDPTLTPTDAELAELREKIERYTHGLERNMTTRGVDIQDLGSLVSNFGPNCAAVIDLISATSRIPQRILMGSERGELASSTDQSNYDDRVQDRRTDFAATQIVRPFTDRLISLGALPAPAEYETRWPDIKEMDDDQRMSMAVKAAQINKEFGGTVITENEIRDRILGYPPLEEVADDAELDVTVEDDETDAVVMAAARSPIKRVRLLRLTSKGRRELRRMAA